MVTLRVSIDGPTASGKSSLGQRLSLHVGVPFLDTGLTFRAATYLFVSGIVDDLDKLAGQLGAFEHLPFRPSGSKGEPEAVIVDGQDVTQSIFSAEVDNHISDIAQNPELRLAVLHLHLQMVGESPFIVAGRDVAPTMFPQASPMVFLYADFVTRRERRRDQVLDEPYRSVSVGSMTRTDYSTRSFVELSPNGIVIDTSGASADEVFRKIADRVNAAGGPNKPTEMS